MSDEKKEITAERVYNLYARRGLEPAEISDKLEIGVADVHLFIGNYYRVQEAVTDIEPKSKDGIRADRIEADQDIDVAYNVDTLRIERMSKDSVWLVGYTEDGSKPNYNYWFGIDEDGLYINQEVS